MTKLPFSVAVIVSVLASSSAFAAEKTITLAVQHMTCAACPGTVKASLQGCLVLPMSSCQSRIRQPCNL